LHDNAQRRSAQSRKKPAEDWQQIRVFTGHYHWEAPYDAGQQTQKPIWSLWIVDRREFDPDSTPIEHLIYWCKGESILAADSQ